MCTEALPTEQESEVEATMPEKRIISYAEAVREAMTQEMERDADIIFLGQDISGGAGREKDGLGDTWGGSFGVSRGMSTRLGAHRVLDCPLAEAGYIGAAAAASTAGLRVIAELMFNDFLWLAGDQLFNGAAKLKYLSAGSQSCRLTVRTVMGGGLNAGMHHSQCLYAPAAHVPGVKVVAPATPYDAKGMLIAAIRDDDPVIVFEHKALYDLRGEVPEEPYEVPIGKAFVVRGGTDVSLVAISKMRYLAMDAAKLLEKRGVSAEVIDCASIAPLDEETLLASVRKTGHLVVVDEADGRCGAAADIAALAADKAIDWLDGPVKLVTAPHTPVPFAPALEQAYLPTAEKVAAAALQALGMADN